MISEVIPSSNACWKVLSKEEGFTKHKSVDAVAPKEKVVTSWCDFIISLAAAGLETLLSLLLQQLPNL